MTAVTVVAVSFFLSVGMLPGYCQFVYAAYSMLESASEVEQGEGDGILVVPALVNAIAS